MDFDTLSDPCDSLCIFFSLLVWLDRLSITVFQVSTYTCTTSDIKATTLLWYVNPCIVHCIFKSRCIIRNYSGGLMLAFSAAMKVTNPSEAELRALHQGVFICKSKGCPKFALEGDCMILVENLRKIRTLS